MITEDEQLAETFEVFFNDSLKNIIINCRLFLI